MLHFERVFSHKQLRPKYFDPESTEAIKEGRMRITPGEVYYRQEIKPAAGSSETPLVKVSDVEVVGHRNINNGMLNSFQYFITEGIRLGYNLETTNEAGGNLPLELVRNYSSKYDLFPNVLKDANFRIAQEGQGQMFNYAIRNMLVGVEQRGLKLQADSLQLPTPFIIKPKIKLDVKLIYPETGPSADPTDASVTGFRHYFEWSCRGIYLELTNR
ncbi:MAG TPA: hypothetical protein DCR93_14430 [Cytophagales bacterium]|nr:hypothetical protein [Cytophagales bacterium]HAP60634.1 hypothetical protein [Cytophagales bacterium]